MSFLANLAAICVIGIVVTTTTTNAYPTRSGTCRAGPSVGTSSGGTHGTDGMGSLEDNNFVVTIDGSVVTPDSEVMLAPATTVSVTVTAMEDAVFKGYMNRVGGNDGVDAVDTLTVVDEENSFPMASTGDVIGPLAACAEDVSGISHSNPGEKTELTVEFTPSSNVGDSYAMDIQLVMANGQAARDEWVYSGYTLVVGEESGEDMDTDMDTDTDTDTDAPTMTPATEEESMSPTVDEAPQDERCNDDRYCRFCPKCRRKLEDCVEGAPYCAFCQEFCPEEYKGMREEPESTDAECPNLRFGRLCRRCRKFENCPGAGVEYCTFCQEVFPDIYDNGE